MYSLTLPFPAPCLGQYLHPGGFHPQQMLAWPWRTLSGNSQDTLLVQMQVATTGRKTGVRARHGWIIGNNKSICG